MILAFKVRFKVFFSKQFHTLLNTSIKLSTELKLEVSQGIDCPSRIVIYPFTYSLKLLNPDVLTFIPLY